jgi:5-methylcytosine-specific restriction endonuclease McrA
VSKSAKRRARRLDAFVEHIDRKTLWDQHKGICGICRTPVTLQAMTIDHVVPLAKGGLHSYANCQPSHESCNLAKADSLPEDYREHAVHRKLGYLNQPALA